MVIEVVLKREKADIFRQFIESSERTITSEFFRVEIANVIRKYYKRNYKKREDCNKILELFENLVDEFVPVSENNLEALDEAIRLDYSAYDILYLTLARRTGAILLTLDKPLKQALPMGTTTETLYEAKLLLIQPTSSLLQLGQAFLSYIYLYP
ncbi:MAG: type II toxin-antitoxin system VapC family toxin [Treponema sp.]|jgi:predicted nucleic acid-binding protein|nr:type II toxin-antitoxin system VapC family toxin [Treponema sp.]